MRVGIPVDIAADRPPGPPHEEVGVGRVFEHRRVWRLTQDPFTSAAALIAGQEPTPEVVVGIARGGVPLARLLGAHYGVPVVELVARHNRSDAVYLPATGQVELPEGPDAALAGHRGAHVLLVDDICGTGSTYRAAVPWLATHLAPAAVRTAALCRSKAAAFTPDTWVWDTLDWVVFPWDDPAQTSEDLVVPASPRVRPESGAAEAHATEPGGGRTCRTPPGWTRTSTPPTGLRRSTPMFAWEPKDERCATAGAVQDSAGNPDGGALQHQSDGRLLRGVEPW
jgi:hypoxanthine phosphoribosyltransferase